MIDYIRGKLVHIEHDYVVVDVHDVGYRVFCSQPLALQGSLHTELTLYIHYNVREDAILLFGFPTRDEQFLFRKLLDVTGIGPRVALGILAGGSPQDVVVAIQEEDLLFLTKLPGIGRKTAQRIVLDLKDKLAALHMADHGTQKGTIQNKRPNAKHAAWQDVAEALMSLGYHETETDKAWQSIKDTATDQESVDSLMKKALKALYQG